MSVERRKSNGQTMNCPMIQPELVEMLTQAAAALRSKDIAEYVWLRGFVRDGMIADRAVFERRFSAYYGLNSAGLTPEFKTEYSVTAQPSRHRRFRPL